jgi:hypothetical protein
VPITFELLTTDVVDAAVEGARSFASDFFMYFDDLLSGAAEHENEPPEDLSGIAPVRDNAGNGADDDSDDASSDNSDPDALFVNHSLVRS